MIRKNSSAGLQDKLNRLRRLLAGFEQVGIAFSGGADSSFLLRTALDVPGPDQVIILHARSCLQKRTEQERAASWPERHGYDSAKLRRRIIDVDPLAWQEFRVNPENRCYLCKRRFYSMFLDILRQEAGPSVVLLDGSNLDDLHRGEEGRPGLRAVAELGVRTPLADCRLSKKEIREVSRELELDTWNQPSSSCLATRIPHSMNITAERLARIASLEQAVLGLGFEDCRVQLSKSAKEIILQLPEKELDRFGIFSKLNAVRVLLNNMGAKKVFLDLDGR